MSWGIPRKIALGDSAFDINVSEAKLFLRDWRAAARERKKHAAATHKYQTFIIDLNDKLSFDAEFQNVTSEEERNAIHQLLARERQTIEVSAARVSSGELEKRLEKLKEKFSEALYRYEQLKARPGAIRKLNATIQKGYAAIENATTDAATIEEFKSFLKGSEEMMVEALGFQPLERPRLSAKDLLNREKQLYRKFPDLKKPPRKPQSISFTNDPSDPDYEKKVKELKKMGINVGSPPPKLEESPSTPPEL
jgi:DNA primase large subunit